MKSESEKYDEIKHEMKVGGNHCYHSFLDLRGDTIFRDWEIRAISDIGLVSEPMMHKELRTKEPSRRQLVQKEILRTKTTKGDYIDSDFYQGFVQREDKLDYLVRLEEELATLPDEVESGAFVGTKGGAKKRWGKLKFGAGATRGFAVGKQRESILKNDDSTNEQLMPGYTRRKKQFTYRISELEKQIEELALMKEEATSNRR